MTETVERRERAGAVAGIALGLVALIGAVFAIGRDRTRSLDPATTFAQWFEPRALPFGLAPASAAVLASGREVLQLAANPARSEPARGPIAASKPWYGDLFGSGETKPSGPPIDWTKIDAKPAGDPPLEAIVMRYPLEEAKTELRRWFEVQGQANLKMMPPRGGRVVVDQGELPWGKWSARYVMERELEEGGTFRDVIRVNLTRGVDAKVMFVRFPRGSTGSTERVEDLLAALEPR
jgi:hypothetical protein